MASPTRSVPTPGTFDRLELPFEPLPQFRQSALEETAERASNRGQRIGIFIVAYNALTTLGNVLKRITPDVWQNVEQVAVFDDASQDATYELAVGIQAMTNLPKLRVLKHTQNLGYGGNQKAGYRYFIEEGFDVVVLLHGDGQYAPELLSHMYAPLVRGEADAVFGSRMMRDFGGPLKGGMPLYKYVGNRLLTAFENRALGLNLTEFHSGYRAYSVHALAQINLDKLTDDFHFDTEIIIKLHHQNFRIAEVPIPTFYGDEICRVNGLKYAKAIVRAVRRYTETSRSVRSYPEYEEYFVPYAVKQGRYSDYDYAARLVGTGQRVLEIGCGNGGFGKALVRSGNAVWGVDNEPNVSGEAGYQRIYSADLEQGLGDLHRREGQFDRILLLNRLEHLRNPACLLEDCRRLLEGRGKLIVSVPNAVNVTVRLMVLFGSFRYADRGIMDWSHLRFFTRKSVRNLIRQSGFRISAVHYTVVPLERLVPVRPANPVLRFANKLLQVATAALPGLLAYEVVVVAER
ncbi:MAG TPA: bifunctional glycosyltransferase/class I SAM-dependent methyltransferase [Bryobacteraceae bacterium]|jgi:glycosyltransferase involved in cell wall biosynthesis|nr:bifunctional glycosyltransferase/class I SAM-dependent methyltransferase [Bryobacteraceae bacterium]